jgi:hypothetical protein
VVVDCCRLSVVFGLPVSFDACSPMMLEVLPRRVGVFRMGVMDDGVLGLADAPGCGCSADMSSPRLLLEGFLPRTRLDVLPPFPPSAILDRLALLERLLSVIFVRFVVKLGKQPRSQREKDTRTVKTVQQWKCRKDAFINDKDRHGRESQRDSYQQDRTGRQYASGQSGDPSNSHYIKCKTKDTPLLRKKSPLSG